MQLHSYRNSELHVCALQTMIILPVRYECRAVLQKANRSQIRTCLTKKFVMDGSIRCSSSNHDSTGHLYYRCMYVQRYADQVQCSAHPVHVQR